MVVIADTREPQMIIKKVRKRFGDDFKLETLSYGDYLVVGDRYKMVIERKNIFDLFASIRDKRIWKQIEGMRGYGDDWIVVLLIEGNKWRVIKSGHATYPQYMGVIASLLTIPRLRLVFVDDRDELVDLLDSLNKKAGKPPREITWNTIRKGGRTDQEVARDILLAFNGVGAVKVKEIMENESTLISLFRKTKKKLVDTYGKVGEHIYNVLHSNLGGEK